MKNRRLSLLLLVAVSLMLLRWLDLLAKPEAVLAEALPRSPRASMSAPMNPTFRAEDVRATPDDAKETPVGSFVGNAFAVRLPPVVYVPPAPPSPKPVAILPPPPPPPPPPPFQVIGTWDDAAAPGVFVSSPNGTLLARKGGVLIAEYRVTGITNQQLTLEQISSKREIRLAIPRPSGK